MNTSPSVLTPQQVERYHADGYLIVPELLTGAEVSAFLGESTNPKSEPYGLHGHLKDAQYRHLATHPRVIPIVTQLLGGRPRIVQTMFLNKAAAGGKGIALHQDCHYLPNEPNTLMACWLALTDTDPENGGLCVVPGSHQEGLRRARRNEDEAEHASWETKHQMRDREGREWEQTMVSFQIDDLEPERIRRLTVPRGAGVFFTGMTIHGSFANRSSDRPRPAFATHYVREDTWLFRCDVQETMLVTTEQMGAVSG
jgi:ectoine hydroxylase-related dioxygenase (phytanoyl-CoA dioxygenase family)